MALVNRLGNSSVSGSVMKFAVAGLIAFALVAVVGAFILNRLAHDEAIRGAEGVTQTIARTAIEPNLVPGLIRGEPEAIDRMDEIVRERVMTGSVVRVKLWTADGRIVYSDERRLIGSTYPIDEEHEEILWSGAVASELSSLGEEENRFEPQGSPLLEVYLPVDGPGEEPLLLETYQRFESILSEGDRIWQALFGTLLGALLLLFLLQLPLAWGMARRLEQGQIQREALLRRSIEASVRERHRIAANLHDGVVQRLAGFGFALAALAEQKDVPPDVRKILADAAGDTRATIRELRTLLVDIYPPTLHSAGLEAALVDLVAPLNALGIEAHIELAPGLPLDRKTEALLFRAAREALNNVVAHSHAKRVEISISAHDGRVELAVHDDGHGFQTIDLTERRSEGHLGLTLLEEMAEDSGGSMKVLSIPHRGTSLSLEVPVR